MKKYEYGRLSSRIIENELKWFFSYGYDSSKRLDKNVGLIDTINTLGQEGWLIALHDQNYGEDENDYILYREINNE